MTRRTDSALNGTIVTADGQPLPATTRALMVTEGGNVEVTFAGSESEPGYKATLPGLLPGLFYPIQVERIHAAGTTATGIFALW